MINKFIPGSPVEKVREISDEFLIKRYKQEYHIDVKKYLENVARGKTKIDVRNLKNLEYHTKSGSNFCLIIEEIKKS